MNLMMSDYYLLRNRIGDYFAEAHKWDEAVQYYEKAKNLDQVP
jgi:hypothetical protein